MTAYGSADAVRAMAGRQDWTDEQITKAAEDLARAAKSDEIDRVHPMLVAQYLERGEQ